MSRYTCLVLRAGAVSAIGISLSYVLGTVVGEQYHSGLLNFHRYPERKDTHRCLVRNWYAVALIVGFLGSLPPYWLQHPNRYLLFLGAVTVLLWIFWCAHAYRKFSRVLGDERPEFIVSSLSLGVTSAMAVIAAVAQLLGLVNWGARCG